MDERVSPLDFLEEVYTCEELPVGTRLRAAIGAAPFVHPKLAMTAVAFGQMDYSAVLRRRMERTVEIAQTPEDKAEAQKRLEDWDKREPIPQLPYEGDGDYLERIHRAKGTSMDLRPGRRQVLGPDGFYRNPEPQVIEQVSEAPEKIVGREGPKRRG